MSNYQKTSDMGEFREYAELLQKIKELNMELLDKLSGDVPKSVYLDGWEEINHGQSKLRSDLEERMYKEHPQEATPDVFYGGDENK